MSAVTLPPRKRRRPALSCFECRRRKIKCDRNLPCSNCRQSKRVTCTYKDSHSTAVDRHAAPRGPPTPHSINDRLGCPPEDTGSTTEGSEAFFFDIVSGPRSLPSRVDGSQSEKASWGATPDRTAHNSPSEKISASCFDKLTKRAQSPRLNKEGENPMSAMGLDFSTFEDVMIQDGDGCQVLRTKVFKETNATPIEDMRGTVCKTRFFGPSHWMNILRLFPKPSKFKDEHAAESVEVRKVLESCKRLARAAKAELPTKWHLNPSFKDYIPPRELGDKLVDLYLRTCESSYRILHIPWFKQEYSEYWDDPASASTSLAVRILLVMAIGTCFYQGEDSLELRKMAQQWVYSAQSYTAAPFEKGRLNTTGIQIYCLLLLARQTNAVGGDLIWTASGTLLRVAFSMGYHRDPKYFPKIPLFIAEIRRRIWATVLEMAVQTSLDAGMPPLIMPNDFDTEPPSNIDDEDFSQDTTVMPPSKPNHVYTQASLQITLLKSLRTRLEIVQYVNNFRSEPSYDTVLRFDREITNACHDASRLIRSYPASLPRPTALQRNIFDILVRRFLLNIHCLFSVRSKTEPRYYFSRKVTLETALELFFLSGAEDLPPEHDPHIMDDYKRLKVVGGVFFKDIILYSACIIARELILQLEEDGASGLPPSLQCKASREPLYQAVQDVIDLTTERMRAGGNDPKGHLFLTAAAAQIQAMTNGIPPEDVVPKAVKQSALHCLEILRARTKLPPSELGEKYTPESNVSAEINSMEETDFGLWMLDGNMDFNLPQPWVLSGWEMA